MASLLGLVLASVLAITLLSLPGHAEEWSPPVNISQNSGYSSTYRGAPPVVDSNGGLHVVWRDDTAGNFDIFWATKPPGGTWSAPVNVSHSADDSDELALAIDTQDCLHLVWRESWDIFYASKSIDASWSPIVNVSQTGEARLPDMAVDGAGTVHVVWLDGSVSEFSGLLYAAKPLGNAWSSPITLSVGQAGYPAIAVDSEEGLHLVWDDVLPPFDSRQIFYATKPKGGTWSTPTNVSETTGGSQRPHLVIDDGGCLHLIWETMVKPLWGNWAPDIFYATKPSGGSWSVANISQSSGDSREPHLAADAEGLPHIVWQEDMGDGNWDILYAAMALDGSWSKVNISGNPGFSFRPVIAVDGRGKPHVAWDDKSLDNWEVLYATRPPQGWSPPQNLSDNSGSSLWPVLVVDAEDNLHVLWSDDTPDNREIFYRSLTPPPLPGAIQGQVLLWGRTSHEGAEVSIEAEGVRLLSSVTDGEGRFAIEEVPEGSYTVIVESPTYLPASRAGVEVWGGLTMRLPLVTLLCGDLDEDGVVGLSDLTLVAVQLNTKPPGDPRTDIDNDGLVDIFDLVAVAMNYNKTGSPWLG
ncbi:MAG TPA: hypothetical protein G4O03_07850 [Dehalococcoidia bacterium]|nr:hypothetical protein [Dehalococcoidia bacterium]